MADVAMVRAAEDARRLASAMKVIDAINGPQWLRCMERAIQRLNHSLGSARVSDGGVSCLLTVRYWLFGRQPHPA
eukprot:scaffold229102_cov35-Tisochrysis_lutea.AAC.1